LCVGQPEFRDILRPSDGDDGEEAPGFNAQIHKGLSDLGQLMDVVLVYAGHHVEVKAG